jgi:hypothetical protein
MLSSLVHASLVWHEERQIRREQREESARLEAAAAEQYADRRPPPFMSQSIGPMSERTPLLNTTRVLGGRPRAGSVA